MAATAALAKWNSMTHRPEDDQRLGLEQDAVAGRAGGTAGPVELSVEVSRRSKSIALYGMDARRCPQARRRPAPEEDGPLREFITNRTRHDGDSDIAGMVECEFLPMRRASCLRA